MLRARSRLPGRSTGRSGPLGGLAMRTAPTPGRWWRSRAGERVGCASPSRSTYWRRGVLGEMRAVGWFGTGAAVPSSGADAGDAERVRATEELSICTASESESADGAATKSREPGCVRGEARRLGRGRPHRAPLPDRTAFPAPAGPRPRLSGHRAAAFLPPGRCHAGACDVGFRQPDRGGRGRRHHGRFEDGEARLDC